MIFLHKQNRISKKILKITKPAFLLMILILVTREIKSQNACNPADAFVQYICPSNEVTVGAQTVTGSLYRWYLNGTIKEGPRPGTGNPISYNFSINSLDDAGYYTIEKSTPGFPTTCVFNTRVIYNDQVTGLSITALTANSVNFSWTSQGEFIYIVTTSPNGPTNSSDGTFTTTSSGSANY